jgi:pimeloyl-ACP methyl ester carboxylesterase
MDVPPVQYVTTSDGYSIAYTVAGSGRPMIFFPPGFMNLELLWRYFPDWMEGLAARFRLICFDARGEGLSTRGLPDDLSLEDCLRDVEAVANRAGDESFIFYALGARGHDAVRFALANPTVLRQ